MSLQNKYAPQKFEDLVGNKQIIEAIKLSLDNKTAFCFLFTGQKGIGKTSLGKIIKNYLNCSDIDCHEYNNSDDRGIDTARDIIEKTIYAPASGVRIFQLEEFHNANNLLQNAILKILESPPKNTYFVITSTEPEKILDTVKSRCQVYNLKPLNSIDTKILAVKIFKSEGVKIIPAIINRIVENADGSARDLITEISKVIHIPDEEKALKILEKREEEAPEDLMRIFRLLLSQKPVGWFEISDIIKNLKGDFISYNKAGVTYFSKCILNENSKNVQKLIDLSGMLEEFLKASQEFKSPKPYFINACLLCWVVRHGN